MLPLRDLLLADGTTRVPQLMETDLVTCDPDDDQEDVADAISKYNLLAIPVVDEDRRLLGIVTVDDALEVLEEEHGEDLMIAGGRTSDADESSYTLTWLLDSQLWFFFWLAGTALVSVVTFASGVAFLWILSCAFMPVALLAADAMVDYAVGFFLEFDADDEDAPSLGLFTVRGLAMAVVYVVLGALLSGFVATLLFGGTGLAFSGSLSVLLIFGIVPMTTSLLVSFATAPVYVRTLRRRDEQGKDSRRLVLRIVAFCVAIGTYLLAMLPMMAMG